MSGRLLVGTTIGELVAVAREDGLGLVVASRCGLLDDRHKLIAWTQWLTWRGLSDGIKAEGGRVVKKWSDPLIGVGAPISVVFVLEGDGAWGWA